MNRKDVVIPAGDLEKQRDFTRRAAGYLARLGREPRAFVDTYGCQQNVSDSQRIMGMLREMGCVLVREAAEAAIEKTRAFFNSLGLPATLAELGIGPEHFGEMARKARNSGFDKTFVPLSVEDIVNIYQMSL